MAPVFLGVFLSLMALILLVYNILERNRLERLTRNLGGKWTWKYILGRDWVPYLIIRLWPDRNDDHTAQIMVAATHFLISVASEGNAVLLGKERIGHMIVPFYQIMLVNARQPVLTSCPVSEPEPPSKPKPHIIPPRVTQQVPQVVPTAGTSKP